MHAASVIIPAFNAAATIAATLEALAAQDLDAPFEIVVVDDGSTDETAAIVRRAEPDVRLLEGPSRGPGEARNRGLHAARGEVVAFTDADCVPTAGWLRAGIDALSGADLVQGAVRPEPSAVRMPFDRTVWVTQESGLYECASLFARRERLLAVGGFEDLLGARIGKQLAEDTWLGWRLRRSGARTAFCERALVHHAVFRRGAVAYVGERLRLVYFPAIVEAVPELRGTLLWRRAFLTRRSALFDAAILGVGAAAISRAGWPALAAFPYVAELARGALRWRRHAPRVALAELAADALGCAALLTGSLRQRTPVL